MDYGFIKIHRQMLEWEWYDDINVCRLFLHLLLRVNYEPKKWHGIIIGAGQILTSRNKLVDETGLSERQVRLSLDKLKTTNEVTSQTTNNYTLITICNWNKWQVNVQPDVQRMSNGCPTDVQQTSTTKEIKETKEDKNIKKTKAKKTIFATPSIPDNWIYFCNTERPDLDPHKIFEEFGDYWRSNGELKADWFATWRNWIRRQKQNNGGNYGNSRTYDNRPRTVHDNVTSGFQQTLANPVDGLPY